MKSIKFLRNFLLAGREHREVEEKVFALLDEFLDRRYAKDRGRSVKMARYAQKNFFSILFLSVYKALGIRMRRSALKASCTSCSLTAFWTGR